MKRAKTGVLAGTALCWLLTCAAAWGNHNTTETVSIGPNGGNGAISRTTDRLNGSAPVDAGTVADMPFPLTVPCAATANTAIGATCAVTTTADSLVPGSVREVKRTIWQVGRVALLDGGADGLAATADNSTFATQGLFVP